MVYTTEEIQVEATHYFEYFYEARREVNIDDLICGIQDYPHMFNEVQNDSLFQPINL